MSILSVEAYDDILLDNDECIYEITAVVEDQVVVHPAVYNPPDQASPEEYGPAECWTTVSIPHQDGIDPKDSNQFLNYLDTLDLEWNVCHEL